MPPVRSTPFGIAFVATILLVAACGVGQPGASGGPAGPSEPSSSEPSATDAAPSPGTCPTFVEVVESGPMPGDDGTEEGPVAREQQRLDGDVQAAVAYGAEHPDEFASVRYENGPRVRIVIGFTAHIEEHCAALRELLEYPEEFEIIRQPATETRLLEIQQEIIALAGEAAGSVGSGAADGTIHVQLRADGESIADEIRTRFGDLVTITVGLLGYPGRVVAHGGSCAGLAAPAATDLPLEAIASLAAPDVISGRDFRGRVVVRNVGAEAFDFQSGPTQTAVVYRLGADTPSGFFTGGLDSIGFGKLLAPGESVALDVLGGTASCDPALGYALPPGGYEVRVQILQLTMHDNAPTEVSYLLSGPVPLTIVP